MKKSIVVHMNKKSIDKAVFQLKVIKKFYPKMQYEFMQFVCEWIINRANYYLESSDIGDNIKTEIQNGWEYDIFPDFSAKISNRTEHAVFVEFGVGVVGQNQPHPNAKDYKYNVQSPYKRAGKYHDENTWRFIKQSEEDVDLPEGSYEAWQLGSKALKIITTGAKGTMYAYNAIVDAKMDLANPNGELATEWNKILERYIG